MKIKLKIDKATLLLLNNALLDQQILMLIWETMSIKRMERSIAIEIRDIIFKKFFTQSKTSTVELYKHSAVVFLEILQVILSSGRLAPDQFIMIDQLKNEIHQKIQIL